MGLLRFMVHDRESLPDDLLERIYMTGLEEIPWQSRCYWDRNELVLARAVNDSGSIRVPWRSSVHPETVLSTASLMERERPYQLEVELARGTLNLVRNQIAAWQLAGLQVPVTLKARMAEAGGHFAKAATSQHEPAAAVRHAERAIDCTIETSMQVGESYAEQALAVRRRQTPQLTTLLGINLGHRPIVQDRAAELTSTFNTAVIPFSWRKIEADEGKRDWSVCDRQVQWCQASSMKTCGGPLLQFDPGGIPDWTVLFEDELEMVFDFMIEHVQAVVQRYRGRVHLWQVASRVNFGNVLSLSEEQRLRIVVRAIEAIRAIDARTPLVVSFDQPWAECLASRRLDLSPMHFADTLVRADLGLSGLGLEINAGYWPGGSMRHGLLDYSRLLDRWSLLGLPLLLSLTTPSSGEADANVAGPARAIPAGRNAALTPESQREWIERFLPMMLAKQCVQVIVWNQLHDREPHDFPHSGLYNATGLAKPGLQTLREIRQEFLT